MTLAELKAELRRNLYPTGEADNLVAAHDSMFIEALVDIQTAVACQQVNNITVVPACNTVWKCGRTIFDKPRGKLKRVAVIDKINQTTGREDADVANDYCSEIEYRQTRMTDLEQLVSRTLPQWDWFGMYPQLFFHGEWGPEAANDGNLIIDEIVLASGVDHGTVNRSFGTVPRAIFLTMRVPSGSLVIKADVSGDPTADGFDYVLDGITDGSGYRLYYQVRL